MLWVSETIQNKTKIKLYQSMLKTVRFGTMILTLQPILSFSCSQCSIVRGGAKCPKTRIYTIYLLMSTEVSQIKRALSGCSSFLMILEKSC